MATFGEELGVAGERHNRVINNALLHGAGDERREFTAQAAIARSRQRVHHVGTIINIKLPRQGFAVQRNGQIVRGF